MQVVQPPEQQGRIADQSAPREQILATHCAAACPGKPTRDGHQAAQFAQQKRLGTPGDDLPLTEGQQPRRFNSGAAQPEYQTRLLELG
jgi:hypothetical protein